MSMAGGVPVLQNAYAAMIRLNPDHKRRVQGFGDMESGFEFLARGMASTYSPPSPETRVSFWLAWGLTPDEQLCLERNIDSMAFSPVIAELTTLEGHFLPAI
jgi:hypothetical protein